MEFNEIAGFKSEAGVRAVLQNIKYYPFHFHSDYLEIVCLLDGHATVHVSTERYVMEPKSIHIFNSKEPHKIVSESAEGSTLLIIHIDKSKYMDAYEHVDLAYFSAAAVKRQATDFPEYKLLRFKMAQVFFEYRKEKPSDFQLRALALEIIDLLYSQFHDYKYVKNEYGSYNVVRRKYDGRDRDEFLRVYRIADYIEANYYKKITLNDIAVKVHLSVPFLSKYIKENIGVTFSELLPITRCSEAARLLANTEKSIDDIASIVGYTSRSHLFKHFVKCFGISPSKYRKNVLQDIGDAARVDLLDVDEKMCIDRITKFLNE